MRTCKTILGDPVAEITSQIDRISTLQFARTVLFIHEFCDKIIANQRCEVDIADSGVLSLRDVYIFIFVFKGLLLVLFLLTISFVLFLIFISRLTFLYHFGVFIGA